MDEPEIFAVPRRFDLATVLVAMTGFALLFTAMLQLGATPTMLALAALLFTLVAVAQAIAIRWEKPREASVVAGIVFAAAMASYHVYAYSLFYFAELVFSPLIGAFFGYLVGTLVGGVFLISYYLRALLTAGRWLRWLQVRERSADQEPGADGRPDEVSSLRSTGA